MINLRLVRRFGLSGEDMAELITKNSGQGDTIFLFPEYTFKEKFVNEEITRLLQGISLAKGSHVFCSAYVLEKKNEVEKRREEYFRAHQVDESWADNALMNLFFTQTYSNFGYLVSGGEHGNKIFSYRKNISTIFDSFNIPSGNPLVKLRAKKSDERRGVEYDDEFNPSRERVSFPFISVEGKTLEFRVCADIECSSENDPDMVLVSAHNLFNVRGRTNNSLKNKPLIINDSGGHFIPLAYVDGKDYRTRWGMSRIFYEKGIDIRLLR